MNKKQQELLDKCVRVNVSDDVPLLDGILIIQQRRLHDSGYRMMYVIGQTIEDDKYYLLSTYSDVIDIGNMFSNPAHYDIYLMKKTKDKNLIALLITKEEQLKLIYCIDLIIQNFGENKELLDLRNKVESQ